MTTVPTVELEPSARLQTLVRVPGGESELLRTEYAGVAWLNGKPVAQGLALGPGPGSPRGIRFPGFETRFFLPDSVGHTATQVAGAVLQTSVSLRASGEIGAVLDAYARLAPDPSGSPWWVELHASGHLGFPSAISYRVVTLTPA